MLTTREIKPMTASPALIARLIDLCHATIRDNADALTALDRAIGDADHGVNMLRGLAEVLAHRDDLAARPVPDAVSEAGRILVMSVGGAAGPLYGTLLIELGRALAEGADLAAALGRANEATCRRGRAARGDKTLIDVLVVLEAEVSAGSGTAAITEAAFAAAEATRIMLARRGRASWLGARSIGHVDPGAMSAALLIAAACRAIAEDRSS